jgi:hypothetical protein
VSFVGRRGERRHCRLWGFDFVFPCGSVAKGLASADSLSSIGGQWSLQTIWILLAPSIAPNMTTALSQA